MLQHKNIADITKALLAEAQTNNQRRALIIAGNSDWRQRIVQEALTHHEKQPILWISEQRYENYRVINAKQAHTLLGQETETLIFDAHSSFDPDAFAAAVGTLRGGGLLFMLVPALQHWPQLPDSENARITVHPYAANEISARFINRLVRIIRACTKSAETKSEGIYLLQQTDEVVSPPLKLRYKLLHSAEPNLISSKQILTHEQDHAVDAIFKVVTGHRRRPLVITANRGRGKSSAFGIAAAQLLQRGCRRILLTGPHLASVQCLFEQAQKILPAATKSGSKLQANGKIIEFIAPDELVRSAITADLLLVDEAAAIPTPLLEQLLKQYARIAFATTVHGYEGSGRGFALRFKKVLDQQTPGWKALTLHTPIRWATNDPLEDFVFRALLLDATPAPDAAIAAATSEHCIIERLQRDQLIEDETTLTQLFGLLVLAHYRTRPYDLRHLLDGPNLEIYVMRYHGNIVAAALVAIEGGVEDNELATAIYQGYRRLQGHLMTQTLVAQLGEIAAANMLGARIMRIAVHPIVQKRGLGSALLAEVRALTQQRGFDWIGASFGATTELLRFWSHSDQFPIRIGFSREASSGAHSVVVLQPFTHSARALFVNVRKRFLSSLPHLLSDPLRDLDTALAIALMRQNEPSMMMMSLNQQEAQEIQAFAFHQRSYEDNIKLIWNLTCTALHHPPIVERLNQQAQILLVSKVLQKKTWQEAAKQAGIRGRKQAVDMLRQAVQLMLMDLQYDETSRQ